MLIGSQLVRGTIWVTCIVVAYELGPTRALVHQNRPLQTDSGPSLSSKIRAYYEVVRPGVVVVVRPELIYAAPVIITAGHIHNMKRPQQHL